jgi:hypothetical protein
MQRRATGAETVIAVVAKGDPGGPSDHRRMLGPFKTWSPTPPLADATASARGMDQTAVLGRESAALDDTQLPGSALRSGD